jgi:hypothetical protein
MPAPGIEVKQLPIRAHRPRVRPEEFPMQTKSNLIFCATLIGVVITLTGAAAAQADIIVGDIPSTWNWGSATNSNRFLRDVVMHEHGHGMGMQHVCSSNSSQLMEPFINTSFGSGSPPAHHHGASGYRLCGVGSSGCGRA